MHNKQHDGPAWLSDKDRENWQTDQKSGDETPGLIPKPFDSLPATPRSAPAVTNGLPDEV